MTEKPYALVLDPADNVATLLYDAVCGETVSLKGTAGSVIISENISAGHKCALKPIENGGIIIKSGQKIGTAKNRINPGEWIHLHNMVSAVDLTFKNRIDSCAVKR